MTSKEIVERYFINEKANINETAETCYRMGCTYPTKEKIEEARKKYDQVKNDLDRLEKQEEQIKRLNEAIKNQKLIVETSREVEKISHTILKENKKLEKAIEILKDSKAFKIKKDDCGICAIVTNKHSDYPLSQEECELLEEVFGDEM